MNNDWLPGGLYTISSSTFVAAFMYLIIWAFCKLYDKIHAQIDQGPSSKSARGKKDREHTRKSGTP